MFCAASRHYASPSNDRWTAERRPSRSEISAAGRFGVERPNPRATSPPTTTCPATTQPRHTRTKQWSTMAGHDPRDYVLGQDLRIRILTTGAETSGRHDLVDAFQLPDTLTPLHLHTRYEERLFVTEGACTVWVGPDTVRGRPGRLLRHPTQHPARDQGRPRRLPQPIDELACRIRGADHPSGHSRASGRARHRDRSRAVRLGLGRTRRPDSRATRHRPSRPVIRSLP